MSRGWASPTRTSRGSPCSWKSERSSCGETVGVDDLTVDDEADWQWMDNGLAHTTRVGAAGWQRYDGVGADVEGDGRGGPARSETDTSAGRQVGNPHVPLIGP